MWTPAEMTELLVGSCCATHIPVDKQNAAALPHAELALQTPRFDEAPHTSALQSRHVQQHKFKLPSSSSEKNQSISGSTDL